MRSTSLYFSVVLLSVSSVYPLDREHPIRVLDGYVVVNGVFVEGHGPYTFLLDTGAQTNLIDETLAAEMGVAPTYRREVMSVAGVAARDGFVASSVEVGAVRAESQDCLIAPIHELRHVSRDIRGILGQSFLGKVDYLLDLRRRRLILGAAAPSGGSRSPFTLSNGRMVVATSRGRLVIDSGTVALVLRHAEWTLLQEKARLTTGAGVKEVAMGTMSLRVGGHIYRNITATLVPPVRPEQLDTDGLLPTALFESLYVSNSGRYVVVNPKN